MPEIRVQLIGGQMSHEYIGGLRREDLTAHHLAAHTSSHAAVPIKSGNKKRYVHPERIEAAWLIP